MLRIPLSVAVGVAAVAVLSSFAALAVRGRRPAAAVAGWGEPYIPGVPPAAAPAARARPGRAVLPEPSSPSAPVSPAPQSAGHGRLVLDGHFARRIGLVSMLRGLDLPGKRVRHTPQDHLVAALVNVLAGHDQLQQLSRGERPLRADRALAPAWDQAQFPEVSGVCRVLHSTDWPAAAAVRSGLERVLAPYIAQCRGRAQAGGARLVVDWDLSAKAITTEARSEPFAAYGHMAEGMGKGYQWAEATLRGVGPDGQPRPVSPGGFLRPGSAHPPECVERLRRITEATLGRPRRRPELLAVRLAAADAEARRRQGRVGLLEASLCAHQRRLGALADQSRAVEQRLAGRAPPQAYLRARDERAREAVRRRLARAQAQVAGAQTRLAAAQLASRQAEQGAAAMRARLARLEADNATLAATDPRGLAIELVADAQFGGSELVAGLLEEGYEVTTKATSPSAIARLLGRQEKGEALFGAWERVSANAEVAECAETRYAGCPHPLRLLAYRKHLAASARRPARTAYALLLTSVPERERAAPATVDHYHRRGGTVELLNRQTKSFLGWRGHRLRHAPGLDILGQFVFAGLNFVHWLADTLWAENGLPAQARPGFAEWMQMARAPADVVCDPQGVLVQFHPDSGWPQRSLQLGVVRQPPLPGFAWPGVPIDTQLAA